MDVLVGAIGIVIGGLVGGLSTYFATRSRIDLEHRAAFDRELRGLRMPHYQALHHISECIPREWRDGDEPTRADLLSLRQTFHEWYFGSDAGGMFLTDEARDAYFDLQNELQVIGGRDDARGGTLELTPEEQQVLRRLAHDLRKQLRKDVGTAEPPKLDWTGGSLTKAPPPRPASTSR